jgi:O-antigen biosynthesis protein WbqP
VLKRLTDVTMAIVFGLAILPICIVIALLVYFRDGRPVIFAQQRVGRHGKAFTCYKFRTMVTNTGDHASHHVSNSAITKLGQVLRRSKLDELPQILNVLCGQMSFVGPRPCLPKQTELVALRQSAGVYELVPGITGLAQVRNIDMSDPEKLVACEIEYAKDRSWATDLRILFATLSGNGMQSDPAQRKQ